MRNGDNPAKHKPLIYKKPYLRIIIPVYIKEGDYFQSAFETLKLCLESIFMTVHNQTGITVISNDCNDEVKSYLVKQNGLGKIDRLIMNSQNQGKVDPVVSVMKGCREDLITVSDCDVLFKSNWQNEVEQLFKCIPRVGMVSPIPLPSAWNSFTTWTYFFGITTAKIKREQNLDLDSILSFKRSVGTVDNVTEWDIKPYYLNYKKTKACIGSGHFCATYSRKVINHIPTKYSSENINNAELKYLDQPVEDSGFLRLSTSKGYIYHMGNVAEPWMYDIIETNKKSRENESLISFNLMDGYFERIPLIRKAIILLFRSSIMKRIKTIFY